LLSEYLAGRTPIPCSLCNNFLKFDEFFGDGAQIGAKKIATGHYARVSYSEEAGRWLLLRPVDRAKDQTYFLFGLTQEQLSRTLFSSGRMTKAEVREVARQHAFGFGRKAGVTGNLFCSWRDYKRFIEAYLEEQGEALPDSSGELVSTTGETIGEHRGIHNFTVGQRKGLGVATGSPLYVIQIKPASDSSNDWQRTELSWGRMNCCMRRLCVRAS